MSNLRVPFSRPILGPEEEEAALRVLRSGWLTTGRECLAFETEFAAISGQPFALAVNSATGGLHLACEALGIGEGDHVLASAYTFTASVEILRYLGAHPVLVDHDEGSLHLGAKGLKAAIERMNRGEIPRCKAVVLVHIGGVGVDVPECIDIAHRAGMKVIEDAAHTYPARSPRYASPGNESGFLGAGGDAGVYSFYANKTITTGEGGMIVCRDEALAKRMKIMRIHGMDREAWQRFTSKASQWRYEVVDAGYKYNMTDLAAAIGREQLKKADGFLAERRAVAARFNAAFSSSPYFELPPESHHTGDGDLAHSWHLYCLRLNLERLRINRDEFIEKVNEAGIGTSVHYTPLNLMPYWKKRYSLPEKDFPQCLSTFSRIFSIPIFAGMRESEQDCVIEEILKVAHTHGR